MEFHILGPLKACRDGSAVDIGSSRLRALLALLLVRAGEVISADRLIDDVWDANPPETARHTLHGYVYRLRRALGPEGWRLESHPSGYRLKVSTDEIDARRFQHLAESGRAAAAAGRPETAIGMLEEALGLWRGPVLADVSELVALEPVRARLAAMRLDATEDRIEAGLAMGRHAGLIDELEALVSENPFRERLWGQLMVALYRAGRQAEALRAFQRARENLTEELGIEPGPGLRRLEEQILIHHPDLGESHVAQSLGPHNLSAQRTSFVGRTAELADLSGLLATRRLVTVTGPPGSGKTRLAIEAAQRALPVQPHGVWFVSLAEIEEDSLIPAAIAAALGATDPERPAFEALVDHLVTQRLLLVLDNLEHLLAGASLVGRLLDAAPGVRVLATSRAPLRLSGEQEYSVGPLPLPQPGELATTEDPERIDALALFAARARAIDPRFVLTPANAVPVAEIATRVDGLPLGIELAAARLRHFPLGELHRRLEAALPLLTHGPADRPSRQRTLRDAIAWSYDLLEPPAQALFRRLGVFRGGFTLEAARAVATGGPIDDVVAGISDLVEASLVRPAADADPARYSSFETVREYAVELLRANAEEDDAAARHARFYADLAEQAEPELTRAEQVHWLDRLHAEYDNLRAALRRAKEADHDMGLLMAGRLWRFWHFRGYLSEGRAWLEELLAAAGEAPTVARARGLIGRAGICYWQGDLDAAEGSYREAVHTARQLEPAPADFADEHYPIGTLLTPWWLEFEALLGQVITIACHRGDPHEAAPIEAQFQAVVAQHPEDMMAMGMSMATSTLMRLFTDDLDGARELGEVVVDGTRAIGERWYEAQMLRTLALISLRQERYEQAEAELGDAIRIAQALHDLPGMAMDLDRLGQASVARGQAQRALVLAGAASRLRETVGGGLTIDDYRWETEHPREAAQEMLTDAEIARAWAEGRSLAADDAVAYAVGAGMSKG
jgi:predicted ATPase/DNA-binding SARP family transcriptional activator